MDIEKYIKDNRAKFDLEEPGPQNWVQISQKLKGTKSPPRLVPITMMYKVAASAVIILSIGALIGGYLVNQQYQNDLASNTSEIVELRRYYDAQFQSNLSKLASLNNAEDVRNDIKQLDAIEKEILEELKKHPNDKNDRLIHALIQNYESRIAIMERVLQKVNQSKGQNLSNEHIEI